MTVAIDSNLYTYLLDAMSSSYNPSTDQEEVAPERKIMLCIFLYAPHPIYLTPTVQMEYLDITNESKKKLHQRFNELHLLNLIPIPDPKLVNKRTTYYLKFHRNEEKDCKILAEAEIAGKDFCLTRDKRFHKKLHTKTETIKLMKPTQFWESLKIPKGSQPKITPDLINPLYKNDWWKSCT